MAFPAQKSLDRLYQKMGLADSSNSASSVSSYNTGEYINTGDTAKDSQYLANTTIQRAYADAAAAGINPTWYLTQGGSTSGASSAGAISSTATKEELKIAQQNADSARIQANAAMKNANANTAKAVSSFIPKFGFSFIRK